MSEPKPWFGFIEPKASWSSVIALIISLTAGAYQAYWFFIGPDVRFIQPQQVMFNVAGAENVRMIVPLSFKNSAPSRYSDVIMRVHARFSADLSDGSFGVNYTWRNFIRSNPLAKNDEPGLIYEGGVVPLMVKGASAISRDTEFLETKMPQCDGQCNAIYRRPNKPEPFFWKHLIEASRHSKVFRIDLFALTSSGGEVKIACTIEIDESFTDTLRGQRRSGDTDHRYHAPPCIEVAEGR